MLSDKRFTRTHFR